MANFRRLLALPLLLALSWLAPSAVAAPNPSPPPKPPVTLTVATFNAGLAPGMVPMSNQRIAAVAAAIAAEPFDVMCVQEAWTPEARQAIKNAVAASGANAFHVSTAGLGQSGRDWCPDDQMVEPLACAREKCGSLPYDQQAMCTMRQCRPTLLLTYLENPGCVYCLASTIGKSEAGVRATCGRPPGASNVYEGNNGVMLISRVPLRDVESLALPSTLTNRVALFASVYPRGAAHPIEVACMHASASAPLPPTSGFISWKAEKRRQIEMVMERLEQRADRGPMLLLGDLNTGPEAPDWSPKTSDPFSVVDFQGYRTPVLTLGHPFCTLCSDNTFRDQTQKPTLMDHILYRNAGKWTTVAPLSVRRILDRRVTVIDANGTQVVTNYSDHYGIAASFGISIVE